MALFLKCLSRSSTTMLILFFFAVPGIIPNHLVIATDPTKGNGKTHLSENDTSGRRPFRNVVYPMWGLATGPPVHESEEKSSAFSFQDSTAQDNAQEEEEGIVESAAGIRNQRNAEYQETEDTNETQSQLPEENSDPTTQLPKGNCASADPKDDEDHPDVDTVQLYEVENLIMEHIIGVDQNNDPEEIRMRAYVGERQAFGVQVILQDETDFWEHSVVGSDAEPAMKDFEEYIPLGNSSFTQRQRDYVEEEAINEEGTKIDVKEGSRLRLVCNVTGVETYYVEWRRGANLSFPGGASVVGGRSVLLDYIGREDAGTYSCTATTPSGYAHSSGVSINVQYSPVVGVWARDVDSENVELGCLVEGRPLPTSAWYINNTKISSAYCPSNMEIRSSVLSSRFILSVLSITNATIDDFGYYHCRAYNSAGVSRAYVLVQDDTGVLDIRDLASTRPVKHPAPLENPRLSSFLLGMVPPLYIGLYIIAYLGCYKTSISGVGAHGRFGAGIDVAE